MHINDANIQKYNKSQLKGDTRRYTETYITRCACHRTSMCKEETEMNSKN